MPGGVTARQLSPEVILRSGVLPCPLPGQNRTYTTTNHTPSSINRRDISALPSAMKQNIARVCSVRYRYGTGTPGTELTEVSDTGMDVVPNLPKCPVPVIPAVCLGTYRTEHTRGILLFGRVHLDTRTGLRAFLPKTFRLVETVVLLLCST